MQHSLNVPITKTFLRQIHFEITEAFRNNGNVCKTSLEHISVTSITYNANPKRMDGLKSEKLK